MKVGILGSGMVGQALADGFIEYGNEVMIGTRNASKLDDWNKTNGNKGVVGSFKETAEFGELLVLAVKGAAAKDVIDQADKDNFKGKVVIDPTNPIAPDAPENGVLKFFTDANSSLMEELQDYLPDSHMVKAFNSIGSGFMVNPVFEAQPTMFICGNSVAAKSKVADILDQFGWEVEDLGAVEAARAIEPLCMLWCIPGFLENRWNHAFKLLKK